MVFRRRDKPPLLVRLRDAVWPRGGWRRAFEYIGHRVKRLPDTPHRIALGFACGAFASFTPLFGLHFILGGGIAWVLRANVVAGLIGTIVGNPLTFPLIAGSSLWLGGVILGRDDTGEADTAGLGEAFGGAAIGLWQSLLSMVGLGEPQWAQLAVFFDQVLWPYLVGGFVPGLTVAAVSYGMLRPLVAAYQARRRARKLARARHAADAAPRPRYVGGSGKATRGGPVR